MYLSVETHSTVLILNVYIILGVSCRYLLQSKTRVLLKYYVYFVYTTTSGRDELTPPLTLCLTILSLTLSTLRRDSETGTSEYGKGHGVRRTTTYTEGVEGPRWKQERGPDGRTFGVWRPATGPGGG